MKYSFWIFLLIMLVGCFANNESEATHEQEVAEEQEVGNLAFPGADYNRVLSRDGLENSDTIVNGFPYNHI